MGSHSRSSSVYSVSRVMLPVSMAFGRLDYQPLLGKRARPSPPKRRRAGRHLVTGVLWLTLPQEWLDACVGLLLLLI